MSRKQFLKQRHRHIRYLVQTGRYREFYELFPEYSEDQKIGFIESLSDEDMDKLAYKLIQMRNAKYEQ